MHHPPAADLARVSLVDFGAGDHGHRREHNRLYGELFGARLRPWRQALFDRAPVLVTMIEQSFGGFVGLALVRGLLGARTVGILFRPLPALHGRSLRMRIKRTVLRILRRWPGVAVISLIPFAVEPGQASIANDGIADPQHWDLALGFGDASTDSATAERIGSVADGRRVICAIGRQDRDKGFARFARLYVASPQLRAATLFVWGGAVAEDLRADADALRAVGGLGFDRFLSDAELRACYHAADAIWACYEPDYDQASGVLGRALQTGVPAIVRRGSIAARTCIAAVHPHIALDEDADWQSLFALPAAGDPEAARQRAIAAGSVAIRKLAQALGVAVPRDPFVPGSSSATKAEA